MNTKIIIKKRADDYHASIADNPAIWGCGKSPTHAIGDLIRTHSFVFGIEIVETGELDLKPI